MKNELGPLVVLPKWHWRNFIIWRCPICHKWETLASIRSRRMNTAYCDDKLNFLTSCLDCWEQSEEDWKERWADYNSGRL
jgi:hypothetical protein